MNIFYITPLLLILASCGSQVPEKYTYDLNDSYGSAKAKVSAFNKASETKFGWTTNNVKFPQLESSPNQTFTFRRVEWAPDIGSFPIFSGVLVRKGSRSQLTITEEPSRSLGYRDPKPLFTGEGPDRWMAVYDDWVTKSLSVRKRAVVSPEPPE